MDVDPKDGEHSSEGTTTATTESTQSSELISSSKPKDEEEEFEEFPIYRESEEKGKNNGNCEFDDYR
uniref:Uncharacterized protein n=1 Tax=Meloidogyne javanica TaxID=6303 RepID=A0A915LIN6_MELJA